ncbi:MAG: DUF4129 domain-containing protein [Verrucomicrobiae bacterium]|nr:DUF4129 domain-containing protein [Verrucomicrobiae bacterium]NNJ42029.1 DUF4129 domain-containing protein [Akkermansiaceae bacterium]
MKLEDVTAEVRPRVPWESIDLGCALARRHMGSIMKAWALTIFPLWVLLAVVLRNHPVWFIVCTWWLKPVYDRVPMLIVSRALFGEVPSMKDVVHALPKLLSKRLWFALVVGRFSPARSLSLPVSELEGLRGVAYRQRVNLLERNGGEGATMATLVGLLLEVAVGFSMVLLVFMMVPSDISGRWWQGVTEFFQYSDVGELDAGFYWAVAVVRLLSITLMEPFYVSAGFALYINSRTLTEGWDIELAFKRLGARLEGLRNSKGLMLMAMITMSLGVMMTAPVSYAAGGETDARDLRQTQIQEVLADEDFKVHHRLVDVPVESSNRWLEDLFSRSDVSGFMGVIGSLIFYVVLAAGIVGLVYLVYRNRHVFTSGGRVLSLPNQPKTREVMGLNVSPESLPDDVVSAAREAWRAGDSQLCLSLLYRGAIASLIHRRHLPIEKGDTEGDCLRRVELMSDTPFEAYFSELTRVWVMVAYGKRQPDDGTIQQLCENWPFDQLSIERSAG